MDVGEGEALHGLGVVVRSMGVGLSGIRPTQTRVPVLPRRGVATSGTLCKNDPVRLRGYRAGE